MKYTVTPPDGFAETVARGPRFVCWQGDELCAFFPGGSCTAAPCTCELGRCEACPPDDPR
jgi:hypothetical protein